MAIRSLNVSETFIIVVTIAEELVGPFDEVRYDLTFIWNSCIWFGLVPLPEGVFAKLTILSL